ncbi:MAG TPA: M28 family peptidase [Thermoanaerobaculia bacterium]
MRALIRSVLRVSTIIAVIVAAGVALIRQPVLLGLPYDAKSRANPQRLEEHVVYLTTDVKRCAECSEDLDAVAGYITESFRKSGGRLSIQEFDARGSHYVNVGVQFGPAPTPANPLMIVGAHYDAFCNAEALPGADDNASGVAALLELARLLGTSKTQKPVMLVAYANEEPPFFGSPQMGSAIHAASLTGKPVAGMICLEMIGYYGAKQRWPNWTYALLYPSRGDFIAVGGGWDDRKLVRAVKRGIRGAGGVRTVSFTGPRTTLDASDQRNYWSEGWPAVLVTDTAFLRNPHYHTRGDTAETLDYTKMARVTEGVFNAVSN